MKSKSKWDREERAKRDKEQTILTNLGIYPNLRSYAEVETRINPEQILICPFCLESNFAMNFILKMQNKFMAKCPKCKQQVQFKTLFNMLKMTGKDFADWVYPYATQGFWKKIYPCFHDWKQKLIFLGMSTSFWERYKELKGEYEENYEDKWKEYNERC